MDKNIPVRAYLLVLKQTQMKHTLTPLPSSHNQSEEWMLTPLYQNSCYKTYTIQEFKAEHGYTPIVIEATGVNSVDFVSPHKNNCNRNDSHAEGHSR